MSAQREEMDRPVNGAEEEDAKARKEEADRIEVERMMAALGSDPAAELERSTATIMAEYQARTDALMKSITTTSTPLFRVEGEQIGHRTLASSADGGRVIVDHAGGLKRSKDPKRPTIVTADDLEQFGEGARNQLPRLIRLGVLVPVVAYNGPAGLQYIDLPSKDHIPFTHNQ
jgi:hypothetical protein